MKVVVKQILIMLIICVSKGNLYSQVPFVPTPQDVVEGMLSLAKVNKGDMVYDLGCGDGRIVITAAKEYGAYGIGIDNNPLRIKESKENAERNSVTDKVEFREQNLFTTDLSNASVVTLYLLSEINLKLRPKLLRELRPGSRVVSHSFDMDEWEPDIHKTINGRSIYFWKIPVNASGEWIWTIPGSKEEEKFTLSLNQQFQKVNGTLNINKEKYELLNPKLSGDSLEFNINQDIRGTKVMTKFAGKIEQDKFDGNISDKNIEFTFSRTPGSMGSLEPSLLKKLNLD